MRKQTKRKAGIIAIALSLSLAFPQTPVVRSVAADTDEGQTSDDSQVSPVTGSAAAAEELRTLIRGNLIKDYDPAVSKEMDIIHEVRSRDVRDIMESEAQGLKNRSKTAATYQIYDINSDDSTELFMFYKSGKKLDVYRYDDYDFSIALAGKLSGVTEVYKNKKKKQIVVVTSQGSGKKAITSYKITGSGKLKSVSAYTQNKKTYKNGKKKITKKAFDKYYKSVKKLGQIKPKKIPEENYLYTVEDESFYSKDLFYTSFEDDYGRESLFMTKNPSATAPQDKCLAYWFGYDRVSRHNYSEMPGIRRYVFGPDVVDKKTGKTYQEEDWDTMYKQVSSGKYAPSFLMEGVNDEGKTVLDIEADGELHGVDKTECTATNGNTTYKAVEYTMEYGDCQMRFTFFTEGDFAGRIAHAGMYYPYITGDAEHEKWTFIYGAEAVNPSEHDVRIYDWVTAGGADKDVKVRTLTIDSSDPALAQTVKTGQYVSFELFSGSGQFYSYKEDGTTKWLLPEEDTEENVINYTDFDRMLNPGGEGQYDYGDPVFEKKLFWDAK